MSRYVGWGGLADCFDPKHSRYEELKSLLSETEYAAARESTLTAFYTPPVVIRSIYAALGQMDFRQGNVLEPACGVGHFLGMLPEGMAESKIYGVELDDVSGRIARQLYPRSSISVRGYADRLHLPVCCVRSWRTGRAAPSLQEDHRPRRCGAVRLRYGHTGHKQCGG